MTTKYRKLNKTSNIDKTLENIEEKASKVERFVERNQKLIGIAFGSIIIVIVGYYGYRNLILAPKEKQANEDIFSAIDYLKKDSLDLALNGDGQNYGFIQIIDEFSGTKTANLAKYYAGGILLKQGEYDRALKYLKSFSSKDKVISSQAKGNIGDIFMELERYEKAKEYYLKAAEDNENEFSTPIFLKKAAMASIALDNWKDAGEFYSMIKKKYPDSSEAQEADKFIARGTVGISNNL